MKTTCNALGVAYSNVHRRLNRGADWVDGRLAKTDVLKLADDAALASELGVAVKDLGTYGYRRATALVNRVRNKRCLPLVNHKRALRVMQQFNLTLRRAPRKPSAHKHRGKVAVEFSDMRWCSDGFEIQCWNKETVTVVFAKDCADRELISWEAACGKGLPGQMVESLMIRAVETRFDNIDLQKQRPAIEFLSDNGSGYIAKTTRQLAKSLGLKPINTPVCSPQSNGMAESFVNTFRRDYEWKIDKSSAHAVLEQLHEHFEHYNEIHPHSALKMMSPRQYRQFVKQQQQEQNRDAQEGTVN
jgi:putative transposase